jgi:nucleoside-diphosphate-sugar epimerase
MITGAAGFVGSALARRWVTGLGNAACGFDAQIAEDLTWRLDICLATDSGHLRVALPHPEFAIAKTQLAQ